MGGSRERQNDGKSTQLQVLYEKRKESGKKGGN